MDSVATIFQSISGIVWIALAVFELVIAIVAQNKHRIPATSLMIIGAVMGLLCSLYYPLSSYIFDYSWFESSQVIVMIMNVMSTLLLLVGFLQLINYLSTATAAEDSPAY